jgi:hypothetical protein
LKIKRTWESGEIKPWTCQEDISIRALDAPDIGHVARETPDKIAVFGGGDERYDIPIAEIHQIGANV